MIYISGSQDLQHDTFVLEDEFLFCFFQSVLKDFRHCLANKAKYDTSIKLLPTFAIMSFQPIANTAIGQNLSHKGLLLRVESKFTERKSKGEIECISRKVGPHVFFLHFKATA